MLFDLLIEGIQDSRIHPEFLGEALSKLTQPGWVKLNRLGDSLANLSRLSPLHSVFIALTIDCWLSRQDKLDRDAHHLLSLELDLFIMLGMGLSDGARKVLDPVKGSSKTAKLAKGLLAKSADERGPQYYKGLMSHYDSILSLADRMVKV